MSGWYKFINNYTGLKGYVSKFPVSKWTDKNGMTPFSYKIDLETIKLLIGVGLDPNIQDIDGNTSLHHATTSEIVEYLISEGVDLSIRNNDDMCATEYNIHSKSVNMFLHDNIYLFNSNLGRVITALSKCNIYSCNNTSFKNMLNNMPDRVKEFCITYTRMNSKCNKVDMDILYKYKSENMLPYNVSHFTDVNHITNFHNICSYDYMRKLPLFKTKIITDIRDFNDDTPFSKEYTEISYMLSIENEDYRNKELISERINLCKFMLKKGLNPNGIVRNGTPYLFILTDSIEVDLFLQYNADNTVLNSEGKTLFHVNKDLNILKVLVFSGANPNALDSTNTPAIFTSDHEHLSNLVKAGADINRLNGDGKTLLQLCNSIDDIKRIMSLGFNIDTKDSLGNTIFYTTIPKDKVELLLKYKPFIYSRNKIGESPIIYMVKHCNTLSNNYTMEKALVLLLKYGFPVWFTDNEDNSVYNYCASSILKVILEYDTVRKEGRFNVITSMSSLNDLSDRTMDILSYRVLPYEETNTIEYFNCKKPIVDITYNMRTGNRYIDDNYISILTYVINNNSYSFDYIKYIIMSGVCLEVNIPTKLYSHGTNRYIYNHFPLLEVICNKCKYILHKVIHLFNINVKFLLPRSCLLEYIAYEHVELIYKLGYNYTNADIICSGYRVSGLVNFRYMPHYDNIIKYITAKNITYIPIVIQLCLTIDNIHDHDIMKRVLRLPKCCKVDFNDKVAFMRNGVRISYGILNAILDENTLNFLLSYAYTDKVVPDSMIENLLFRDRTMYFTHLIRSIKEKRAFDNGVYAFQYSHDERLVDILSTKYGKDNLLINNKLNRNMFYYGNISMCKRIIAFEFYIYLYGHRDIYGSTYMHYVSNVIYLTGNLPYINLNIVFEYNNNDELPINTVIDIQCVKAIFSLHCKTLKHKDMLLTKYTKDNKTILHSAIDNNLNDETFALFITELSKQH